MSQRETIAPIVSESLPILSSSVERRAWENEHIEPSMHLCFPREAQCLHRRDHQERSEGGCFPDCVAEVREMRARIFYDDGRRPFFRRKEGNFDDPDPADMVAYHIIARWQGRAIGCARIVPPSSIQSGFIASTVGAERLEEILLELGIDRDRTCEASRWVVVPEFRGSLGSRIVAASWAVARWLCFEKAFVLACTCEKQDILLMRMGARPISGLPLFASRISHDQFRLLHFDVLNPGELMQKKIAEIATVLNIVSEGRH